MIGTGTECGNDQHCSVSRSNVRSGRCRRGGRDGKGTKPQGIMSLTETAECAVFAAVRKGGFPADIASPSHRPVPFRGAARPATLRKSSMGRIERGIRSSNGCRTETPASAGNRPAWRRRTCTAAPPHSTLITMSPPGRRSPSADPPSPAGAVSEGAGWSRTASGIPSKILPRSLLFPASCLPPGRCLPKAGGASAQQPREVSSRAKALIAPSG